jgi:peptide chain release factor 1
LDGIENKYEEIGKALSEPGAVSDQDRYRRLMKEFSDLAPLAEKSRELKKAKADIADAELMLGDRPDRDLRDFLQDELASLRERLAGAEGELRIMLLPKDPNDGKNVIIEIRAGAGGEEAALFAGVLFRMYSMYADARGWRPELLDSNPTEIGGYKEIVFAIDAPGAYSRLKFESGVHRVQRVPATESSGRIHTSTATVAVLPEMGEVDVRIDPGDIEIDTYRASGAGGQHINKTDSAIRITHKPTGLVVTCQDQRSQYKNKDRAMAVLRSRLYEMAVSSQESGQASARREQVGTGMRNERIRTYNYPQGRVTDHRIGLTLYKIDEILNGGIDEIIDGLISTEQARKIAQMDGGAIGDGGGDGDNGS